MKHPAASWGIFLAKLGRLDTHEQPSGRLAIALCSELQCILAQANQCGLPSKSMRRENQGTDLNYE